MLKRVPLVALLLALVGLVAAPAVQASDAGLRKVITKQEDKLVKASEEFSKTSEAMKGPEDFPSVIEASKEMRETIASFKKALTPVSGSTANGKKGKTKMLAALKALDDGFIEFEEFFEKAGEGATEAQLKSSQDKLEKRFDKATKLEQEAFKLLKIKAMEAR